MGERYPFHDFAIENGYSLYSHSIGIQHQVKSACYVKNDIYGKGVFLSVDSDGNAKLEKYIGLIECKIIFSLPNKNFVVFERQMMNIVLLENN